MQNKDFHFENYLKSGQPVGEVVSVTNFLVKVRGLQPVSMHAQVLFEDGSRGFVQQILENEVAVLHLGTDTLKVGMVAVLTGETMMAKVGREFIGRVISVTGSPLDGKGAIPAEATWPIFNSAPTIYQRQALDTQLETGVISIDAIFPIVKGQRLALLGDSKSGKSTLATQIAINQRDTDQVVVYVMIAKRRSDVDTLITRLNDNGAMSRSIVVVATIFESLVMSYLAPYVGCALAEYLWQKLGQDSMIIYDDLTAHAHAHREISLLSGTSPGRDSYPGDMFYAHSSLLERAGRIEVNHACLTSIPIVMADSGDITAYLPTNIMSITDGQWILDMEVFRSGVRPSISTGLSVTRVGGVGHNKRQKDQNGKILKAMAGFNSAEEFARFGSELTPSSQRDLSRGRMLHEAFTQKPGETFTLMAQQLILDVILNCDPSKAFEINKLKELASAGAKSVQNDDQYPQVLANIKSQLGVVDYIDPEKKDVKPEAPAAPPATPAVSGEAPAQPASGPPQNVQTPSAPEVPATPVEASTVAPPLVHEATK